MDLNLGELKQNTAAVIPVRMPSVDDAREGVTGATLTVELSKNGGAFSDVTSDCTVVERTNGLYSVTALAGHADTAGWSVLRISATGAEDVFIWLLVVSRRPADIPTLGEMLAGVVEGSLTLKAVLRILLSFAAGKTTGGGTTAPKFRDLADTKDRISGTVTAAGNRTAVTLDGSD